MATYLSGSQDLRRECGVAGTGPATVLNQTGESDRLVKWYRDAYSELQTKRRDWLWMRKAFTVNTVAGTPSYAYGVCTDVENSSLIARFSVWYRQAFKAYLQSDGVGTEYPLIWMEWETFRRWYQYGTQNAQQPIHVSVGPDRKFYLGPTPNAVYVVSGDYQRSAQVLAADADVPEMPDDLHSIIMYDAMKKYAVYEAANEVYARAVADSKPLRMRLMIEQLPPLVFGNSLA